MKDTIKHTYLAADFGGGSGRIIAGFLLNGRLELEEIYRFSNRQVKLGNHIYWDFPALFEDMKTRSEEHTSESSHEFVSRMPSSA